METVARLEANAIRIRRGLRFMSASCDKGNESEQPAPAADTFLSYQKPASSVSRREDARDACDAWGVACLVAPVSLRVRPANMMHTSAGRGGRPGDARLPQGPGALSGECTLSLVASRANRVGRSGTPPGECSG